MSNLQPLSHFSTIMSTLHNNQKKITNQRWKPDVGDKSEGKRERPLTSIGISQGLKASGAMLIIKEKTSCKC